MVRATQKIHTRYGKRRTLKQGRSKRLIRGGRRDVPNIPRSVMGKLLPPVNITSETQLPELGKRTTKGQTTLFFIYAPWCGHCERFKPTMDKLEAMPNRTINIVRLRDDMFPRSSLRNEELDGYPTLMLMKNGSLIKFKNKQGKITNSIPNYQDFGTMKTIVTKGHNVLEENIGEPTEVNKASNRTANRTEEENPVENTEEEEEADQEEEEEDQEEEEEENNPLTPNNYNTTLNNTNNVNNTNNTNNNPYEVNQNTPTNIANDRIAIPKNKNIVAGPINPTTVAQQNSTLDNIENARSKTKLIGGGYRGGSLFASLTAVSNNLIPAASLFLGTQLMGSSPTGSSPTGSSKSYAKTQKHRSVHRRGKTHKA